MGGRDTSPVLAPVLGRTHLLALGIGAIIGSGVFVAPGLAAARFAGPALTFSLLGSAVACALAGLCYAELAALFPVAGSAYSYTSRVFGRALGWIIGWLLISEYLFAAASLAIGWAGHCGSLLAALGWPLPQSVTGSPLVWDSSGVRLAPHGAFMNVPAVAVLIAAGLVATRNVRISATVNAVLVCTKVGIIVLVIIAGLPFVDPRNWHPFMPPNTGQWGEFGLSGIFRGAAVSFYVYLGFDTVSVAAQEARNPQRDVPFGILGSLIVCTLLFVPFVLVLTGLTSYRTLDVAQPTVVALAAVAPHLVWLQRIVEIGIVVGIFSVLLVVLLALARILYSMSLDGLVPAAFSRVDPRSRTPALATLLATGVAVVIAALLPIALLAQMVSVGALVAFMAASAAVLVLRRQQPNLHRPFRAPWVPFVPIAAVLVCGALLLALPRTTLLWGLLWLSVGLSIYAAYGRKQPLRAAAIS
jgi:APA family basic amino acid/polyamine antiporter